jgi:hypothetical protein
MSRARNLADLLDSNGDVVSGALDNVPPSNDASALTTGTLSADRIGSSSITAAKLANDAKVVKSATAPASPTAGDLWFDTVNKAMKTYSGTAWDQLSNKFAATGGTVTESGGYKYHTFTSSGTFTAEGTGAVEYLIVAGGGSGGVWSEATGYADGNKGSNSSFNSQTAIGGGGGKSWNNGNNADGGSGGGGSGNRTSGGSGTSGQGNSGGAGDSSLGGGGGGGAGASGGAGNGTKHGDGGVGKQWLNGTYYAGGGGGGGSQGGGLTRGLGGNGGGGNGGAANTANPIPSSGSTNTGGGGGAGDGWYGQNHGGGGAGGYISSSTTLSVGAYSVTVGGGGAGVGASGPATEANKNVLSGAGGSGIVIIRYAI